MITLKTAQSKPRPNCLRRLILTLTVICALAEPISCSAMREMRQNDLNEQSFTALEHGSAAELAALLDEGADPNYVPHSQHEENVLSALLSSLRQGRIALNVRHGLPMLGYALNGFSNEDSRTKAHLKQLKAKHLLPLY